MCLCGCTCLHLSANLVCGHIGMWQSRQRSSQVQVSKTLHWQFCHLDAGKSVLSGDFTNLNVKGIKQCITVSLFNNHNKQNSQQVSLRICLIVSQLMIGFSTKSHTSGPWLRPLVVSRLHRNSLNFMKPAQTRPPLSLKRTNKIACAKNSACAFFGFTSIDCLIVAQSTQALILTLGGQGWHWRETDSIGWHVIESN